MAASVEKIFQCPDPYISETNFLHHERVWYHEQRLMSPLTLCPKEVSGIKMMITSWEKDWKGQRKQEEKGNKQPFAG